jgi:hypothetical protein
MNERNACVFFLKLKKQMNSILLLKGRRQTFGSSSSKGGIAMEKPPGHISLFT